MNYSKDVLVVVPIYKDSLSHNERISFNNMLKVFSERSISLVAPKKLIKYVKELSNLYENLTVTFFEDEFFKSTKSYNRLLMDLNFYKAFKEYRFLLICQLDVYVFKDDLDYWINKNIDNIGAPIFEGYTKPTTKFKALGNNGGFCLRNIEKAIRVLSTRRFRFYKLSTLLKTESIWYWKLFRFFRDGLIYNYDFRFLKPIINEDIFWSVIVPCEYDFFTSCPPKTSMYFAFDANPKLLFEKTNSIYPTAIHAWWRYDEEFVKNLIKNKL